MYHHKLCKAYLHPFRGKFLLTMVSEETWRHGIEEDNGGGDAHMRERSASSDVSTSGSKDSRLRHEQRRRRSSVGERVLQSLGCFGVVAGTRELNVETSATKSGNGSGDADEREQNGERSVAIIRRISTAHEKPPQELPGFPSAKRVSEQFSRARRVATLRRYVRTGSRIAIGLQSLEENERNDNGHSNTADCSSGNETFSDIQNAQVRLLHRLKSMGLTQVIMGDDGNCQFRALSWQLYGTQNLHGTVREDVVKWMRNNASSFMPYFDGKSEFEAYLKQMSRNRTWGDELTVRAACDLHRRKVHIITTEENYWYLSYVPEGEHSEGHIFLTYISPIHYNTVKEI